MLNVFNGNEINTDISDSIAYFERDSWYSYMLYEKLEKAEKDLEQIKRTKN